MKLEHASPEKLKKEILAVIGTSLDLNEYKVFFFGSRVTGRGNDRSDIDVGIEGHEPIPRRVLHEMKNKLDNIRMLYSIDLVDFKNVSPEFYETARQYREFLN